MANEYITDAQLKLQLGGIDFATNDALLNAAREGASRSIDARCGRRFYADGAATARVFNPAGRVSRNSAGEESLYVDDISTTSGLIVEIGAGTYTAITTYETEPENALVRGRAIDRLRLPIGGSWQEGTGARVRVTADWGWPTVPAAIVEATLILAARLYKRKDSPEGNMGNAEWGVLRVVKLDPDVERLVADYAVPGFA